MIEHELASVARNLSSLRRAASEVFTVQADNYLKILDSISLLENQIQELAVSRLAGNSPGSETGTCVVCNCLVPVQVPNGCDDPSLRILGSHVSPVGRQTCAGSFGTPAERFMR